jgi:hypothetical protein
LYPEIGVSKIFLAFLLVLSTLPAPAASQTAQRPARRCKVSKKMFAILAGGAAGAALGVYFGTRDSASSLPPRVIPGAPSVGGPR